MANIVTVDITKIIAARAHAIAFVLVCIFATVFLPSAKATAQTKTLKLYYLHTGEKNTITYYKNGKYRSAALKKINWALRDWRRNEPTKMDPKLLDLVWEAYRRSGSKAYIHVISGYRSPITNEKLRKRGGGQAKKSQHTLGKALDFYLPDVKISKMRAIGLKMGVGGVGYYPRSGSPFVHLDTGSVRHWPRMTRTQLAKVFPRGKTMHVPTDGKPLARYKVAVAEYKSRTKKGKSIPTAATGKKDLNFFQRLAARSSADESEDSVQSAPILPRAVKSIKAPVPTPAPAVVEPVIGTTNGPAEIEVAAPLSITDPVPTPNLPEETKPEFAILAERRVPFPVASPRNVITPTSTPVVAPTIEPTIEPSIEQVAPPSAEQTLVAELLPEQQSVAPQIVEPEILTANELPTEPISEPAFTIPTPTKRPKLEVEQEIQLASLETKANPKTVSPVENSRPAQVSTTLNQPALTANEIEDLRQSATQKIEKPVEQQVAKQAPVIVATTPELVEPELTAPIIEPVAEPTPEPIVVASKTEDRISTDNQLALADDNLRSEKEDAISAIEKVTKDDNLAETTNQELEPAIIVEPIVEPAPQTVVALNNIPIPTKNPRFKIEPAEQIVTANLDPEIFAEKSIGSSADTDLGKRTVSLDKLTAPQENENVIGQYAIANNFNIRDLNAVKAPTYGRNVLRKTPTAVFVDGFKTSVAQRSSNGFSGKAIVFKKFARLTK